MRKFQIQCVRSDGCGSFYHFDIDDNATDEEIFRKAEEKIAEEKRKEFQQYYPAFWTRPPHLPRTMKVVETDKTKSGQSKVKRNGLKFKLRKNTVSWEFVSGVKETNISYKAGI